MFGFTPSVDGSSTKMIAILMKVFKNLFGNGSKIHAGEIVGKDAAGQVVGLDMGVAEVGQNANGSYVRWNNGLQMCWIFQRSWPGSATNQTHGQEFTSPNLSWTYPKPFIQGPIFFGGASGQREVKSNKPTGGNVLISMAFRVYRSVSSDADADVWLGAIGWWKEPGT